MDGPGDLTEELELLDWKRRVFDSYRVVRKSDDPAASWGSWRSVRDELFARHPQSPLTDEARRSFSGLRYFGYEAGFRTLAEVEAAEPERYQIATSGEAGGSYAFTRFATARFQLEGIDLALELYWLEGYGGGLFLPFRDATSGADTYGAGRYLFDTVKGADLGDEGGRLVLDFNYAYNPSCAYDPKWVCPLAPPPNRLHVAIEAGERNP
jgi:uncharacterized protein (DUF1684 family)